MACSAATSMAALLSSQSISPASSSSAKPFVSRFPRSFSSISSPSKRRSFVARASELPLVGNTAPDFEAKAVFDQQFIKVKLSEYIGKKYVILFFYPLDFTFVCPTEITAFSDRYEEFQKLNTEVLGVSIDSVFSHLAWVQTDRKSGGLGDLKYPLVSDVTKSISKSYGVLIPDQGIALRGLFIIDKDGVIQHSTVNNLAIGRSVDETLRTLQVLYFPSHSSESPAIALPPSLKSLEDEIPPVISLATSDNSQIQETLLYLDSLGVDSFYCLHSHPTLISTPVSQIKSTVDFLFSLGITTQDLRRIFPLCPELLTSSTSKNIIPATTFLLREARVEPADLRHAIHRRPRLLICNVERQLRPTLYFLQGTIGIDNVSKWTSLLSCSVESKFIPRIEYLQKLGFSYRDTIVMFRRFPSLFCYSIKENFEPKFNYFVVEMGRELKELVAFPQYFSFSLQNRIKPRHRMCVEKGVCLALPTMLKLSEARFWERLEVCCSSSMPVRTSPLWCTRINTNVDNVT